MMENISMYISSFLLENFLIKTDEHNDPIKAPIKTIEFKIP